ncbi:hypothetical protein AACH06_25895 [Ideonella sp. DXS29W]|uniref:Uncharacterized protein n=1 Tax=Ideonella lacteola TaxID=2984193 RepID=A0ABU9BYT2_9BURK
MGRPFPTCDFADSGNGTSSENEYIVQGTCPEMYKQFHPTNDRYLRCTYRWRIPVYIDGYGLWEIVYWDTFGTSTWYSDAARENLEGQPLDPRYDEDQAAWDKAHQPPPDDPGPGGS